MFSDSEVYKICSFTLQDPRTVKQALQRLLRGEAVRSSTLGRLQSACRSLGLTLPAGEVTSQL